MSGTVVLQKHESAFLSRSFASSEMDVRDINFIARELCAFHVKPLIYLHYIVHREKLVKPGSSTYPSIQYVLRRYPCDDKLSDEAIVNAFLQMMNSPMSVTQKVKYLVFVKQFQLEYPGYLDSVETYPSYNVKVTNISNGSAQLPDKSIVWELNHICPELCGMFFENMLASVSNSLKNDINDMKDCLLDFNDNTTAQTIVTMLARRFLKKTLVAHISQNNIITVDSKNGDQNDLCDEDFESKYHALMFRAMKHFWKYNCEGKWYESALSMLEFITKQNWDMKCYTESLASSTVCKIFQRENITHGTHLRINESADKLIAGLHGETDFSGKNIVADCKVQKDPTEEKWFVQLYLYKRMLEASATDTHIDKLYIVDLYDNNLYSFTIC